MDFLTSELTVTFEKSELERSFHDGIQIAILWSTLTVSMSAPSLTMPATFKRSFMKPNSLVLQIQKGMKFSPKNVR